MAVKKAEAYRIRRTDEPDDEHDCDGWENGRHDPAGETGNEKDVLSHTKNGLV